MDTNRLSLIITIEDDCSSVKFKRECDGTTSNDQDAMAAAIYAAVTDIALSPETFDYYLAMAEELSKEQHEEKPEQFKLKLVH